MCGMAIAHQPTAMKCRLLRKEATFWIASASHPERDARNCKLELHIRKMIMVTNCGRAGE